MALPADDLTVLRKWTGTEPSDTVLEGLYAVYENYDKVVEHVLVARLAELSSEVGSVTVPGLSISHSTDLQATQALLKKFYSSGGTGLEDSFDLGGLRISSVQRNFPR